MALKTIVTIVTKINLNIISKPFHKILLKNSEKINDTTTINPTIKTSIILYYIECLKY